MNGKLVDSKLVPWVTLSVGHVLGALGRTGVILCLVLGFLLLDTSLVREVVFHSLPGFARLGVWLLIVGTLVGFAVGLRHPRVRRTVAHVGASIGATGLVVILGTLLLHHDLNWWDVRFGLSATDKWAALTESGLSPPWVLLGTVLFVSAGAFLRDRATPAAHTSPGRDRTFARTTLALVLLSLLLGTRHTLLGSMYAEVGVELPWSYQKIQPALERFDPWAPWVVCSLLGLGLVARIRGGSSRRWRYLGVALSVLVSLVAVETTLEYLWIHLDFLRAL